MQVLKIILIILEVVLLFNLLIFVHELGHFLAARWRGLKVERFAIWFGKPIWSKRIRGVEYAMGWIPAGGYVSLPQMATMEAIEGKTDEKAEQLPPISALDKIIVAFAGPLFSFGLAIAFAIVVWLVGRPVSEGETTTVVGYVVEEGPAAKAGIKPGDKILSVDGHEVHKFGGMGASVQWRIVRSEGEKVPIVVQRGDEKLTIPVSPEKPETKAWERKGLRQIGILPAQSSIIGAVYTNSPAHEAGLQAGDEVVSVDGQKFHHFVYISQYIEQKGTDSINVAIRRGNEEFTRQIKPEAPIVPPDEKPRLGILWSDSGKTKMAYPHPVEQVIDSVNAMISTFGALFSPKSDIKAQHLGGAVKIMDVYARLFAAEQGWRLALWFSVLMNVNLAVLNMLPFPVLDGGHITLAVVEGVRRRPVSPRLLQYVQTGCAALLIGFMLYIAFYDVQELGRERQPDVVFAPSKSQ